MTTIYEARYQSRCDADLGLILRHNIRPDGRHEYAFGTVRDGIESVSWMKVGERAVIVNELNRAMMTVNPEGWRLVETVSK